MNFHNYPMKCTLKASIVQMRKLRLRGVKPSIQYTEAQRELQVSQTNAWALSFGLSSFHQS